MSAMTEKVTGAITVSVAGIQATLTHSDVEAWGNSLMSIAPLLLILFLIWRIYKLDQQHKDCQQNYQTLQANQSKMQEQILMTFLATRHPEACPMPSVQAFKENEFTIPHV